MAKSKHEGHVRQFIVTSQAWYSAHIPSERQPGEDKIYLGMYVPGGGGTSGEFVINWEMVGETLTPRLQVYCGAWSSLMHFQDVIAELAKLDGTDPSVDQVIEVLTRCGVEDVTERVRPGHGADAPPDQLRTLTEVCRFYQSTLDRVRNLAREMVGDERWGADAELGKTVRPPAKLDALLWDEFMHFAKAVGTRRAELMRLVDSDTELAEALKDILVSPEDLRRICRRFK